MTKTFKASLFAAAATLALGATAAQADVTIATAGPMTGPYASFGEQMAKGAEMAVKDINAAGGVLGEKVILKIGDDVCDPKQAVAVANQMANDGVKFMAGHFCSSSSIPASEVYDEEGILMITPASTNPTLTDRGLESVFRVCGRDDQQGSFAAEYIAKNLSDKKIAILHDKTAYGKGLADQTKLNLNKAGVNEVLYEAITAGEKDYSALISKLKANGTDIIYLGGYHTEAGLIIRQAREQGLDAALFSGDALNSLEFGSIAGPAGDGTMFTFGPEPRNFPEAAKVVKAFNDAGYDPEGYTLYTYAAIQAWKQGVEKAGSFETDEVSAALKSGMQVNTVLGNFSFTDTGDTTGRTYVWYMWKDGNYKEIN